MRTLISVWNSFTERYDVLEYIKGQWYCIKDFKSQIEADTWIQNIVSDKE